MIKAQGRSRMVFPITRLTFQVRKVIGGGVGGCVACKIIVSVPVPLLWTLDLGIGTWILDLDFGLGFPPSLNPFTFLL